MSADGANFQLWTVELVDGSAFDLAIPNTYEAERMLMELLDRSDYQNATGENSDDANAALMASAGIPWPA